jgi:hypothetical protein
MINIDRSAVVIFKVYFLRSGDLNLLQVKNTSQEKNMLQLKHHLEIKEVVTELEENNIQDILNIWLKQDTSKVKGVILAFQTEGVSLT